MSVVWFVFIHTPIVLDLYLYLHKCNHLHNSKAEHKGMPRSETAQLHTSLYNSSNIHCCSTATYKLV